MAPWARTLLGFLAFRPLAFGLEGRVQKLSTGHTLVIGSHPASLLFSTFRIYSSGGDKCLNFMHIPKTAGTSIELDAWELSQKDNTTSTPTQWGSFDHGLHCKVTRQCPYGPPGGPNGNCCVINGSRCSAWHVPPAWDREMERSYQGCETFCVVRDPYWRAFSEFKFETGGGSCTVDSFRAWVQRSLRPHKSATRRDCHFIPQVDYVYSPDRAIKYCQHVLRFERIEAEFNQLMEAFQIPIRLRSHALRKPCEVPRRSDIERLIFKTYKGDYLAFNYTDQILEEL